MPLPIPKEVLDRVTQSWGPIAGFPGFGHKIVERNIVYAPKDQIAKSDLWEIAMRQFPPRTLRKRHTPNYWVYYSVPSHDYAYPQET